MNDHLDGVHDPRSPSLTTPAYVLRWANWLFAAALVAVVFLVYQPAWRGGFVLDDDAHVTCPELRSWHGLYRIWFEVGVTQQYDPLLETSFWVQHKLWGDAAIGYHLVNIAWHAMAAALVLLLLLRLKVPGAYLATAIFALHPVHVESVAWITEQKNTLSAVFYLLAALAYLRFDENRGTMWYLGAFALFVLALASKIVTVTLPAALLVVFWWQRGRLSWRRDVLPLVPWFAFGAAAGVFIAWIERNLVGAKGPEFALTAIQRCLLSGRVIWFYFAKLFWPAELIVIYPRWNINPTVWWQYLFPASALLLLAALWLLRRRWRGPLAGFLFFAGTLFPVLGFLNVYWFRFSFVADHHQYLASLGVITFVSAGIWLVLNRWRLYDRPLGYVFCLALLATLAGLTWRQSRMYADLETFYQTTLDRNPECWLAHNNLGWDLAGRGEVEAAIVHFRKALEIKPDFELAHNNLDLALADHGHSPVPQIYTLDQMHNHLGLTLAGRGQMDEAIAEYRAALEIKPDYAEAHNNLGLALAGRGEMDAAIAHYRQALKINPDIAGAHNNLGSALAGRGEVDAAVAHYQKALEIEPEHAEAHNNLGAALAGRGEVDAAVVHYQKALKIKPDYADAHNNLGNVLAGRGQFDAAIVHYQKALKIKPNFAGTHNNLGSVLAGRGQFDAAIVHYRKALEIKPDFAEARHNLDSVLALRQRILTELAQRRESIRLHPEDVEMLNDTAWILATNPNASVRNGAEATELAQRGAKLADGSNPTVLDTLSAAYAESGRFAEAVQTAQQALLRASSGNNAALAGAVRDRIKLYQAGLPYRGLR